MPNMSKITDISKSYTIAQFRLDYPNDDACLDAILLRKYNSKISCPKCKNEGTFKRTKGRRCYACPTCNYQLYPTKGTIFEKSTTPLTVWFYAMFLFSKSKNGLSACELERQTGVNYKTAWRMLMQIRKLAANEKLPLLSGIIECDESFIGGKNINRHRDKKVARCQGRSFKDKTPVLGMFQRDGNVIAKVVRDTKKRSLAPQIRKHVEKGSILFTDEWSSYDVLENQYFHEKIYHNKGEYQKGIVTTNRIENFWSVLKRTIKGSYIKVDKNYLQQYVNEIVFRYNNRDKDVFKELINSISLAS